MVLGFSFQFHVFIDSIQKQNRFQYVDLVSYDLAEVTFLFQEFSCRFLGILYVDNHVICRQHSTTSLFQSVCPFFSQPTALSRTSSIMLKTNSDSGHLWLVPNLRWGEFSLLLLSIMFALGLCGCSLLRKISPIPCFLRVSFSFS